MFRPLRKELKHEKPSCSTMRARSAKRALFSSRALGQTSRIFLESSPYDLEAVDPKHEVLDPIYSQ